MPDVPSYAVVYDDSNRFLMAFKNAKGFFYHKKNGHGGDVYKEGRKIYNGPNNFALPGGDIGTDTPGDAARREFCEETGVSLDGRTTEKPAAYKQKYGAYHGIYFQVTTAEFDKIHNEVKEGLKQGAEAASDIHSGSIASYEDIYEKYKKCPIDNELAFIEVWNLVGDWGKIEALELNKGETDWFYDILNNLKEELKI
jgi:8-oxo-dGTP pyrophosphatase MutT (NUDIX family)